MDQRRELATWGEIASYLGVSVRSAQGYEERLGLPVHRLAGPRGRVFAYADEVEEWKKRQLSPSRDPEPAEQPVQAAQQHSRFPIAVRWAAALGMVSFIAVAVVFLWPRPGVPVAALVRGRLLIAQDAAGRDLWNYDLGERVFEVPGGSVWAEDIDNDGKVEIILAYNALNSGYPGRVLCFSQDGTRIKWRFEPGRPLVSDIQGESYTGPYSVNCARSVPRQRARGTRIAISSRHNMEAPNQVAILDASGRLLGEYWHPGHLAAMAVADLDGDGSPQILLGGVNNSEHSATLIAFDPDHVGGTAAPGTDHRFELTGFGAGTEKRVMLFPRSCLALSSAHLEPFNQVVTIQVVGDRVNVYTAENHVPSVSELVYYTLDKSWNVLSASPHRSVSTGARTRGTRRGIAPSLLGRRGRHLASGGSVLERL